MVRFDDVWLKYRRLGEGPQGPGRDAPPDVISNMSFEIPQGGFRWLTGA